MITAFIGDNDPLREQAVKEYIAGFVGIYGPMAVEKYFGEEIEAGNLKDALSTLPFLSSKRLVVVRNLSLNKNLAEDINNIANYVTDNTDLILIEKHIDSRSKFLSKLKKIAEVKEFAHLEGSDLTAWIVKQAERHKAQISFKDAVFLIDRIGTNHQLLDNELKKLAIYNNKITSESIKELTTYSPKSSVFAMLDAAFSGDIARALILYKEQRIQGAEPKKIIGMIIWQLHILSVVKMAKDLPPNSIADQSKISPYVIRKTIPSAKRITEKKLVDILDQAIKIDLKIKTTKINPDEAVQALLLSFV